MGPSKTRPFEPFAAAVVSLGKSGRYQNRPVSVDAKVGSRWPRFHRLTDGHKLPKNRLWRLKKSTTAETKIKHISITILG